MAKKQTISLALSKSAFDKVQECAKSEHRSNAGFVRHAVSEYLRNKGLSLDEDSTSAAEEKNGRARRSV